MFPEGLTFRAFNGSYGDGQLNDIDGKGFPLGNQINNNQITRTADANFSIITAFPETEPSEDYVLWEQGGAGIGAFVGFRDGHFRVRAGDGGPNVAAPGSSTNIMAILDLNFSTLEDYGFTDGNLYEVKWEFRIGVEGSVPGRIRLWIDDELIGTATTSGTNRRLEGGAWSGGDAGGVGLRGGNSICTGESQENWPYKVGSSLLYLYGQGFKVRNDYVYEETGENYSSSIQYTGSALDLETGGLTGTDNLGAVWFGKLRIGNSGLLRSGELTFGTRSDDGSALWIDLDQDGDLSRSGLLGDEMIVNNLGNHGARNRSGTVFLGYKAPLAMRSGSLTKPGLFAGTEGLSTAFHATSEGESLAIGSEQLIADKMEPLSYGGQP